MRPPAVLPALESAPVEDEHDGAVLAPARVRDVAGRSNKRPPVDHEPVALGNGRVTVGGVGERAARWKSPEPVALDVVLDTPPVRVTPSGAVSVEAPADRRDDRGQLGQVATWVVEVENGERNAVMPAPEPVRDVAAARGRPQPAVTGEAGERQLLAGRERDRTDAAPRGLARFREHERSAQHARPVPREVELGCVLARLRLRGLRIRLRLALVDAGVGPENVRGSHAGDDEDGCDDESISPLHCTLPMIAASRQDDKDASVRDASGPRRRRPDTTPAPAGRRRARR